MSAYQLKTIFGNVTTGSIKLLLGALFPLLVLLYNPLGVDPELTVRMLFWAAVGALLSVVLIFRHVQSNTFIRANKYWVAAWGVYIVVSLLSLTFTISLSEGIFDVNRSMLMGLTVGLFAMLFAIMPSLERTLIWGVWVSAWLLLLWGAIELAMVFPSLSIESVELYKVTATMAHKNLLASAYLLLFPFVLYMFFSRQGLIKFSSFLLLVGIVVMILMLQGRSSWVAFVAMLATGLLLIARASLLGLKPLQKLKRSDKFYLVIVCLTIVALLGTLAVKKPETFNYMLRKISSMTDQSGGRDQNKETIHERYALWDNTWQLIKERPIKGVGVGSWKLLYPKHGLEGLRSEDGYTLFQRPHNDLLWVWSELGLVGLVAYLTMFLLPLVWLFVSFDKIGTAHDRLLASCAATVLVGFLVVGLFSFPRERMFHNLLAFLSVVIIMGRVSKGFSIGNAKVKLLATVLLIGFCWVGLGAWYRAKGEMHTLLMRASYKRSGQQKVMIAEAAKARSFFYKMDNTATPLSWFEGIAYYDLGDYTKAKQCFQEGLRQNPYHLHLLNNLGSSFEKTGQRDLAIMTYRKVLDVSPKYTEGLLNLSAVYFNNGQVDSAFSTINRCAIDTEHPNYLRYLNAILKAKANMLIQDSDSATAYGIVQLLQHDNALVTTYMDARAADISFDKAVLEKAKDNSTEL